MTNSKVKRSILVSLEPDAKRSKTSSPSLQRSMNGMDSEDIVRKRLMHFNLDYASDPEVHDRNIYDPSSRWFSRAVRPSFPIEECLPYKAETHNEQADYLCHVLVNLYISINSLDIQGLISISSIDLLDLKQEVNNLSQVDDVSEVDILNNDIADYDEGEDDEEQFDENEYIDFAGPDFNATGKITSKSATIINVNHWTNELKNCMHFDIPLTLRKLLATVYYYLSLVQGQKIYRQMHVEMFELLINKEDDGTNFTDLLFASGLRLDHKILQNFLCEFLPYPDSDYIRHDISSKEDLQLFRLLLKLAHQAKPFFDETNKELMTETMGMFLSSLAPSTMSTIMPMITSFVPYHYHANSSIIDYFPLFYSLWSSVSANIAVDTHMYDFIGTILEDANWRLLKKQDSGYKNMKFGTFCLLTDAQMTFMFNRLQGHLRSDGQIHSYSRTVRPFIYTINGSDSDSYFNKLLGLSKSIETFVHPSNSGFWTKPIAKFVHGYIKMYHKRVKEEEDMVKKNITESFVLGPKNHAKLVEIFLDLLVIGSQNKSNDVANYYISSFAYLLDLRPTNSYLIFNTIIGDLYEALSGEYVNSRHRIISSLKQFTRVVRYIAIDKLYRVHITNILSMLVSKMDMNDINLTSNIINGIVSVASFIPLENMVKGGEYITFESHTLPFIEQHYYHFREKDSSIEFEYDEEILNNAFRASTSILENIIREYLDKLFLLISVDIEDGFVTKLNNTTMMMQESMDDKLFSYFSKRLQTCFWENDIFGDSNPNYELVTIPLAALVSRDSSLSKKIFDELTYNIRLQIERGAGSIRSTSEIQQRDYKLVFYLTAINDVLRQSRSAILEFTGELLDFMKFIYDNITNPPLDVITSIISHSVLASLTTTEVVTSSLFPADTQIPMEDRWGGMQFDDRKFKKENLKFDWHVPSKDEITTAISLLDDISVYCKAKTMDLLENNQTDSNFGDKIQKYILIMTHALSGASLLFDPDFNKNKNKLYSEMTDKELSLFLKNSKGSNLIDQENDIEMIDDQNESVDGYGDLKEPKDNSTISDLIQVNAILSNEVLIDGQGTDSDVASCVHTPVPGSHLGDTESSTQTFKDLDIYTCNYFFGVTTEEKFENPQYFTVHSIRSNVGLFFHKLFTYLSTNFENNTMVFQILLHGLKAWFADVGQEIIFNEDQSAKLDLEFLENIQSLSHLSEPYTRTCLSIKADSFHQSRVLLHSTSRKPSKLETTLLENIITLAISVYPDIHKQAQGTLVHCMKQLTGSYSIVIDRIIHALRDAIDSQNFMQMEVILTVMMIKKIHRKLMSDYKNLETLVLLLIDCCKINEIDIAVYADKILCDIVCGLKIPSSVCIMDDRAVSPISPPDSFIDVQVSIVKDAKSKKREFYISLLIQLQDKLIVYLENNPDINWKVSVFIIRFVTRIQSSLETSCNSNAVKAIFSQTHSKHPQLIQLSIKSLLGVFNKIFSLSDYEYDITRAFRSNFDPYFVKEIETADSNSATLFNKEMDNLKNPDYFIDSRAFVGWLCWGSAMKVVSPVKISITLKDNELDVLNSFGKMINKDWLLELTSHFVQDNETRSVFSSGNVSFFILTIYLCSKNMCNFGIEDLFCLCENAYDRYDKASMIMSVEIFAALICGSKYMSVDTRKIRDEFVKRFLTDCLNNELNHDAFEIWGTICWWLPTVVDIRRCPDFYNVFSDISDLVNTSADVAANQASMLSMFRNIMMGMEFKTPDTSNIIKHLVIDHPYEQVREAIAKILVTIIQNNSHPSLPSASQVVEVQASNSSGLGVPIKNVPNHLDQFIKDQFIWINKEIQLVKNMTPQEILKTRFYYMASTMYYWIKEMGRGPNRILLVPYIVDYIVPFLLALIKHKDVCKISGLDPSKLYVTMAYMPFPKTYIGDIVKLICDATSMISSYQRQLQLGLVQHFLSLQLLQLTEEEKDAILEFVVGNLYNVNFIEVRVRAADILSDIVHNLGATDRVTQLIERFNQDLGKYSWEERKQLSKSDLRIHGSVVGLGAIISAFPYVFPLPRWIPEQLSALSSWARTNGMAGKAAKNTISEFKKVRTDTWQFDRQLFTSEQLEDLEGVLWRSYYA